MPTGGADGMGTATSGGGGGGGGGDVTAAMSSVKLERGDSMKLERGELKPGCSGAS
jgi:hypothetical protein